MGADAVGILAQKTCQCCEDATVSRRYFICPLRGLFFTSFFLFQPDKIRQRQADELVVVTRATPCELVIDTVELRRPRLSAVTTCPSTMKLDATATPPAPQNPLPNSNVPPVEVTPETGSATVPSSTKVPPVA